MLCERFASVNQQSCSVNLFVMVGGVERQVELPPATFRIRWLRAILRSTCWLAVGIAGNCGTGFRDN